MNKDLIKPLSINIPKKETCKSFFDDTDADIRCRDSLNIDKVQSDLRLHCEETAEEFIFSCIKPFIDSMSETKISKQELVEAVLYINLRKTIIEQYGCYMDMNNDLETATKKEAELRRAYNKGLNDGYQKAAEEAREFYQGKEKENGKEEN
jgi:hypothetical protein